MFDFAWSEIALVAVVALILIGPKDLPVAIRAISNLIKRARRMAGEFQTHVDDMVRDADLSEVRGTLSELRGMDIRGTVRRAIDPDGSIKSAMTPPSFSVASAAATTALPAVSDAPASSKAAFDPLRYDGTPYDGTDAGMTTMVRARPRHMFAPLPEPYPDDGRPAFVPPEVRDPAGRPAFIPPQVAGPR